MQALLWLIQSLTVIFGGGTWDPNGNPDAEGVWDPNGSPDSGGAWDPNG